MKYEGGCHCGAVRFSFEGETITKSQRCNGSICARKGALMSKGLVPESRLKIDAEDGALGFYQFGAKTVKHYFCKNCGIHTFHEATSRPGHYRSNLGCIEGVDPLSLEAEIFDGKHLL